jgi:hypothetical protein
VPRLGACRDGVDGCAAAVTQGKCSSDKQAMLRDCQVGGAPLALRGGTKATELPGWALAWGLGVRLSTAPHWRSGASPAPAANNPQAACGFCTEGGGASVPSECADDLSLCPYLAREGHCAKGSSWMDTQCRRSCGACTPDGRGAQLGSGWEGAGRA